MHVRQIRKAIRSSASPICAPCSLRRKPRFGQRTLPLARQSAAGNPTFAKYRENARWEIGGVMFLTLHVVGSNNGLGRDAAGDAEVAERNAANIAWLQQGFALARANNSRAVMILQQANMFPEFPPFPAIPMRSRTALRNCATR